MGFMFCGCSSLSSLDLSGLDTSKVTDMGFMFSDCSALTSLTVGEGCGDVLSAERHTDLPEGAGNRGWYSTRNRRWFTQAELSSGRQGIADTYTTHGADEDPDATAR